MNLFMQNGTINLSTHTIFFNVIYSKKNHFLFISLHHSSVPIVSTTQKWQTITCYSNIANGSLEKRKKKIHLKQNRKIAKNNIKTRGIKIKS